ncbi:hypothetical protein GCM10010174_88680 [Kutzneria viridogrisea]|uniref:Uncharacterized protein n=1 Tax=Kutzneria viridogrisea TaxID=47990 RepID=A0ABR6BIW7_9PSEU|nr:hypothetical protein [Kutzneria viridogrisea]
MTEPAMPPTDARKSGKSPGRTGRAAPSPSGTTRLTANLNQPTMRAIQRLADTEGVTLTEALRRLVGYGDLLYQAIRLDGDDVLIRRGEEHERIVII